MHENDCFRNQIGLIKRFFRKKLEESHSKQQRVFRKGYRRLVGVKKREPGLIGAFKCVAYDYFSKYDIGSGILLSNRLKVCEVKRFVIVIRYSIFALSFHFSDTPFSIHPHSVI